MRRLPTILAAAFLIIQLARVATFAQVSMRSGVLGWFFSGGLAAAVFVSAYWTRISAYSRDGAEDRRSRSLRLVAYLALASFVVADGCFNLIEVQTVVKEPELQTAALIYGLAPTLASAALGTLQGYVDRIPMAPRRSAFAGVRAALAGRLLILLDSGSSSSQQPAGLAGQQEAVLLSGNEQTPLLLQQNRARPEQNWQQRLPCCAPPAVVILAPRKPGTPTSGPTSKSQRPKVLESGLRSGSMGLAHRVLMPHSAQCRIVPTSPYRWRTEGKLEKRDAFGYQKDPNFDWLVFRCNDPDCMAVMIVKIEAIITATGEIEGS